MEQRCGTLLASDSWDNTVRLWGVADGELVDTINEHTAPVNNVAFSPDGTLLASASWDEPASPDDKLGPLGL